MVKLKPIATRPHEVGKKSTGTSRRHKFIDTVYQNEDVLSSYQISLLRDFAFFMLGYSKITAPQFKALVSDFIRLVPEHKKTQQLEYVIENKSRNLVPHWFRDGTATVTSTDNMRGQHTKSTVDDLDMTESF